jgi:signal transduction histidine kinase
VPSRPPPQLQAALFDVAVAVGLLALVVFGRVNVVMPGGIIALGCVMAVAVLGRRRWPLPVMAVVALAALGQVLFYPDFTDPLPYDAGILVAMYSVVKYGRRMLDAYLAGGVVAVGIGIETGRHWSSTWWALVVFYVGICGGVWLMAYTIRNRRVYVSTLEDRAATLERERDHLARIAVADERAAIARELHDVVAHSLSVMIVQADGGRYAYPSDPANARAALDIVAATGREALEDMRRLVGVLRGSELPAEVVETVDRRRVGLEQLATLAEGARSAGLSVDLTLAIDEAELPPAVSLTVTRLVQEALTNSLQHAGPAARVWVEVARADDTVIVSSADDGGRQRVAAPAQRVGHGLIGMRERVAVHGGRIEAGPRPEGGWLVRAEIPVPRIGRSPGMVTA